MEGCIIGTTVKECLRLPLLLHSVSLIALSIVWFLGTTVQKPWLPQATLQVIAQFLCTPMHPIPKVVPVLVLVLVLVPWEGGDQDVRPPLQWVGAGAIL